MFATLLGPYPRPAAAADADLSVLRAVLQDQLDAGIGMVTDGLVRGLVEGWAAGELEGIVAAWELADDTLRELVAELEPGIEPPPVKACLVGPYSAGRDGGAVSVLDAHQGGPTTARRRATLAIAEGTRTLIKSLFAAGAPVVQLAEDALTTIGSHDDAERVLAADALRRATDGLSGHVSVSVAGGSAEAVGPALFFELPVASYAFDLIYGPDNWRLIAQAPSDRGIVCGVADTRGPDRDDEAVLVWAARYAASTNGRGLERVGLAPAAGLERLPREIARAKLEALAEAARKAGLSGAELAAQVDPLAVDARSAALGRFAAAAGTSAPGKRRPAAPRPRSKAP